MRNETKRDVFLDAVDALADAQASGGNVGHQDASLFMAEYEKALPDDLPVIPKATGKLIKVMKADSDSLFASESTSLVMDRLGLIPFDALKITKWINEHQNTFARAWVLVVWRVEETGEIVKLEAEK